MTDWNRVERLRGQGKSWDEIASDARVGFRAEPGSDPGRSLRALYKKRGAAGSKPKVESRLAEPAKTYGSTRGRLTGRRRTIVVAGGVAGAFAVVLLVVLFVIPPSGVPAIVTYCGGEGTVAHYHVLLVVNNNGVQQHLPYDPSQSASIGYISSPGFTNPAYYCPSGGFHAIHTHDGSGIIHLEVPGSISLSPPPTLGNFFTIWGEPLSSSQAWIFSGHVSAQVVFEGTGRAGDYSAAPSNIPLVVPPGGPLSNPYAIPQSLIFNGNYGNGDSGGSFAGEIIWLNVTA